ncbi:hypothetical protein KP509_33G008500 [Ceratopteris richardii]|uniref:Uncharacterized protein n=1 Tax=Ceratopteris richardii TaxID=49495 RepID=A0A8T2QM67_CERRI|nr:hypothetical protein KP509_33G008500 [Ceratopteris richardii]
MTRIYFKPQGPSSRQGAVGKSRKPTSKSSHLQHHHHHKDVKEVEDPQKVDDGWRSKLEPNAIEQIADGLEKMVMSWTNPTHKVQPPEPDFKFLHNHDDSPDFLSSDALKSSVMEFDDNSEQFSFGTKETTISFVQHHEHLHHNHNQPAHPNASPGQQQTLIVDTIGDPEGLMQELMKGNLLNNGFLSIQNGDSSITEYPQVNGPLGGTSAVWYLAPTLAIPNTLSYGNNYTTVHQSRQVFTGAEIEDDVSHIAHDEHLQQNGDAHTGYSSCGLEESEVVLNGIHQAKSQLENTVSEKLSCRLEALGSESWSETVEINGGTKIKDLLGRKLVGKGNGFTSSMDTGIHDAEYYKKKVEELQIALLECAMEYEVKIVEMKMKALQSKSQEQKVETDKDKTKEESDNGHPQSLKAKRDAQRVDYLKKQLSRVQKEKAAAARELSNLRKRETFVYTLCLNFKKGKFVNSGNTLPAHHRKCFLHKVQGIWCHL